ncbi:MAG TPA: hypothetical protein DF699_08950, partial [Phycisphaerales bacterium]|nr:hypothetical protein [Phycisphaerales bacterium]
MSWKGPESMFEEIIPASAFDAYDTDPVYDPGEAALAVDWFSNTRDYTLDSHPWTDPAKQTTESRVSWNKTTGAFTSGVPADYFAARVTATLDVPETGTWTFRVGSDQYARLMIDDSTVVDDSSGHSMRWRSGEIMLEAGEHELVLEFMEGYGDAALYLTWQGPDDDFERVIPASAFVKQDRVRVVQWREIGG